jgi:alpha-glucoside transport system permease protein
MPRSTDIVQQAPATAAQKLIRALGSTFGKVVLLTIVVLWTIPTVGLVISSFRPEVAIKTTPWWQVASQSRIAAPALNDAAVEWRVTEVRTNSSGLSRVTLRPVEGSGLASLSVPPGSRLAVAKGGTVRTGEAVGVTPRFTLRNYDDILSSKSSGGQLGNYFWNSVRIAVPATIIPILVAAFAAYAFSWMSFRGRDTLFLVTVGLLVVPLQMAFIPLLRLINRGASIGSVKVIPATTSLLNNSAWAVIIAHTCFAMPLAVYLLRNFISQLPGELMEAARVDGASHMRTFLRIVLPLSVPALASLGIFQFLWVWNDLAVATAFGPGKRVAPMTVKLVELAGSKGEEWQRLTAGAFVTMALPLAVFFALQRFFVRGLVTGSVKG